MLDYGNPHMAGVSMILQRLVDDPEPFLFCHQFALTNAVSVFASQVTCALRLRVL
jgi:hypothetical protein